MSKKKSSSAASATTKTSSKKKSMPLQKFDYKVNFYDVDFKKHPEIYKIGRGEQGVLLVEPYKTEICPHWKFKNPEVAKKSSEKIYQMFLDYKNANDFVGADMARKFLQMGYTRSRRYANHKSGRKYKKGTNDNQNLIFQNSLKKNPVPLKSDSREVLPDDQDDVKAQSARVFFTKWKLAREDDEYLEMKKQHLDHYLNDETPEWAKVNENVSKEELAKKKQQFVERRRKVAEDSLKEEEQGNSKESDEDLSKEDSENSGEEKEEKEEEEEEKEVEKNKNKKKSKPTKRNTTRSNIKKKDKSSYSSESSSASISEEEEPKKKPKNKKQSTTVTRRTTKKKKSKQTNLDEDEDEETNSDKEKDPDYNN